MSIYIAHRCKNNASNVLMRLYALDVGNIGLSKVQFDRCYIIILQIKPNSGC